MQALLVVLLATGALAAPFSGYRFRSREHCSKETLRFPYTKELTYNYVGETVSRLNGSSSAQSALKITARCTIKTVGSCQHVLKIDSVELWEGQSKNLPLEYKRSEGTAAFARELQAHELVFRSRNGAIADVSSSYDETPQSLNIKKAILSALQVQFIRNHSVLNETDISGKCPVHYRIHSKHLNGYLKVVSKTRNLNECSDRSKTDLGIHIHQYNERALNLLSSTSNCRYHLTAKRLVQKVVCEEKHLFRPFSSATSAGASTTTKQVLELQPVKKVDYVLEYDTKALPRVTSLTFEHSQPKRDKFHFTKVKEIIQHLARESMEETKPESARLFSRLIFYLRKLDSSSVEKIWDKMFKCEKSGICEPEEKDKFLMYLLDALPHCGTSGCALVMTRAIEHKLVNSERGNLFLTGLALVSVPTEDMIAHVLNLCQIQPSRTSMLTLGTLIHKYCEDGKCDRLRDSNPIIKAGLWLKGLLGKRCDFDNLERAEQIIMALKAIGNAGRPSSENAQFIIMKCATNRNLPMNMTIAAFKALRRMPCSPTINDELLNIYGNPEFDVEIRIEAYLALLKCPSVELFRHIARIQNMEVNKQVGSFVWSHITNAMESTEPLHGRPLADMIRKALGKQILREFNLNRLRFSRAWEASYYNDILRAGGSMQGHVIYHPNSYFPRSTHVNLTVDVLGASINILEAAARFEGLEILIEQFFGPDGYYPDNRIMDMFNLKPHEARNAAEQDIDTEIIFRGKRSVKDDINRVESHLNKLNEKMDIRKHTPSGAVSVNLFGNEMRVASFDDINWLQSEADNVNMVDFLIKLARGGNKTFTKSLMFLDAEITVPTILGLPLKLDAKGTSVVSVVMSGKFDIRNMFWGPMAFDVRGHLKPSAVVEVIGSMGVDATFAEAGLFLNTSMYTSTEIRGNATYKQGQVLKFELGAPSKPVQIFNVSSSLFATLNDKEIKFQGTQRRFEPLPCLNLTRVLGIAVCGRMSLPIGFRDLHSPFFPLSGPASFSLSVFPTDPKLRVYQIIAQRLPSEDEKNFDIITRISTPKATWEREFEANASLWLKDHKKVFSISTGALGYKFGNLSGSYHNYTNAINLTFETRDVLYGNRIALNAQYFNKTDPLTKERHLGISWSAMYKNYTITQLAEIYNNSRTYGFVSNTTYWPGKYIYANGEVSILKKTLKFLANHTCSKTSLRLNAQLNKDENTFLFNVTNDLKNVSLEVDGVINKVQKDAVLRTFILPYKQSFSLRSSYMARDNEKGIHFKASHDNKNRVFAWYTGFLNKTTEKSIKTNASILGKPFEAVWTYFNHTNEKGIKFNGSAIGKSINSAISYLVKDGIKSIKVNASGFDRQAKAVWSYVSSYMRKSLIFDANVMKRSFKAEWAFYNLTNAKSLTFNASGLNRTARAAWTFLNLTNEKVVKFNASALSNNIEAFWSYSTASAERSIKFNASALNKTIESALTFLDHPQEKSIKLNATVLKKKMEVILTFFNLPTEKGVKLSARGFNKSATTFLSYSSLSDTKALKFNATVLNKTVEAAWTYMKTQHEKVVKFNAVVMNKTFEAMWTFFNFEYEKGLRFNAQAMNRKLEGVWSYFKTPSEKGLKFNATVLKKTVNVTLAYFKLADSIGVRFNANAFKKSIGMSSKIIMLGNDKKLLVSGSYQNYSIALVATLKNLTRFKSLCVHSEFLGRPYGQICAIFSNSSLDKSIAFNVSMMNRTAEVKAQRYEQPNMSALRLTAKYNKTIYIESWLSHFSTDVMKTLVLNTTIANRSVDCKWFMEIKPEKSERTIGFNLTVLKRTMGLKSIFINQESFKEASLHLLWNKTYVASSLLVFHNLPNEKIIKLRNRIGNYVAVTQGEYRLPEKGPRREFELLHKIRNGTKMMFYSSSLLTYKSQSLKGRELNFVQSVTVLNRNFAYGWDLLHKNESHESRMNHQFKAALMYSRGKRVSLTSKITNDKKELSTALEVEYLPGKTMQHSVVWYKEREMVIATIELLPRIKIVHDLEWNSNDGVYLRSVTRAFNKNIVSYFRYVKSSEYYDGQIGLLPTKSISFNGKFSRKNGLYMSSTIKAFGKEWSQKLDIDKNIRKFFISVELLPKRPITFEASWDMTKGLKINTETSAFRKSLKWNAIYENLTKSWTSELTILKEKVLFLENFDVNTKTLNVSVKLRNWRIGFVGRFDLKAYVVSAHLMCNQLMTGWFLKLDPKRRNIIYNATLTSRISGQVVAEMPNNHQLQVTIQRKLGVNIVNESRIIYKLSPEASRVFLTWNTTTVNYFVSKLQSLRPIITNASMKLYNLTLISAKNLTKKIDVFIKDAKNTLKPQVMKLYQAVKSYDYHGVYKNFSIIANNMSITAFNLSSKAYNIGLKALEKTIKDLPKIARNATELYKKIRAELFKIRSEFMTKVPKMTAKMIEYLTNISRDLRRWGNNVTIMIGDIKIRDVKLYTLIKRVIKAVTDLQKDLVKNITVQFKKLVEKVRRIEIRQKSIGELVDNFVKKVERFTWNDLFNLLEKVHGRKNVGVLVDNFINKVKRFTWNDLAQMGLNFTRQVMRMKILNKTVEHHITSLKDKADKVSVQIKVLSIKLVKMTPKVLRNKTIESIKLLRNISRELKNVTEIMTKKISQAVLKTSTKVQKYTKPLTSLIVKISLSIYNRAKPQILTYFENTKPMISYVKGVYEDVLLFNKPMLTPFKPFVKAIMNQILNITIKKIPIGIALEKTVKITVEEAVRLFKEVNHTISSNVTALMKFFNDLSKKTPEEMVDITIVKVVKLVNHTKYLVNKSIEYTFNSSKKALTAYKESMIALEKNIKKILNAQPEDLVELSIQKIGIYIQNVTAYVKNASREVQNIAKQIKDLDFTTPSKKIWNDIDLVDRFSSLALDEKWNKTVEKYIQHFKSLNLKERAIAIKERANEHGLRVVRELKAIAKLGERAFNLTMKLMRMDVTREDFVKELLAVIEGSKMFAMKHFHVAKNTTFTMYNLHNKYWNSVKLTASTYKNLSFNKLQESYKKVIEYIDDFYKEHEKDLKETFEFYKFIASDIYEVAQDEVKALKKQIDKKMNVLKVKLIVKLESLITKLRKFENITFEQMGMKVYKLSKAYGLALYKNYSIMALNLYNNTKNVTLRAYNLTLRVYNLTKSIAVKYYNLSRIHAARIINVTKNFTVTYFKISRNMTIRAFHLSRNMTIKLYNATRNITVRGIKYFNMTVKPKFVLYYGKGKVIVIKAYNKSQEMAKKTVNDLKIWYDNNKEKTVEELYNEVYGVISKKVNNTVEKLKAKIQAQLIIANKTVRNITFEVMSVFNQTKNVSIIAGKQLILILSPHVKLVQNKTMVLFLQLKNMSIPLMKKIQNLTLENIKKVKNFTLVSFHKAKNFTVALYRNITNRKYFKEFMVKHQIKERYNKVIFMVNETIEKIKAYIQETKPILKKKYKEAFYYVNVKLPGMIKQKKQEIMANPKEYLKNIYDNALSKVQEMIKNTPIEEVIGHEIWSDYLDEIKRHEIAEISGDLVEFGKLQANISIEKIKEKIEILKFKVEKLKIKAKELVTKAKKMVNDTKQALKKGFNEFKQLKLKEIIEHKYVFKAIDVAKNTTLRIQNMTLQAKHFTLKMIAIGKVFYKNMTIKARNYTLLIKRYALALMKNYTVVFEKVKLIAKNYTLRAENYTLIAKNITIKAWMVARNWSLVKINSTRMWINKTAEKGIKMYKLKVIPFYKNKVLPFYKNKVVPMYQKYRKLVIDVSKNMTKQAYNRTINSMPYKFTIKSFNFTIEFLRNVSKMTPRETAIKMKQAYVAAYKFTVKSSFKLMNVSKQVYAQGLKTLNVTKMFVVSYVNSTIKLASQAMKPVVPLLNFTKTEIIETAIFLNKYYGIEKTIRSRVDFHYKRFQIHSMKLRHELHRQLKMLQNHSEDFMLRLPGLMKDSAYGTLELVNKTIRYVHHTVHYLNATMLRVRRAIPNYIRIEDGIITVIVPHPKPVTGDIVSICNDACNTVKSLPETAMNMTLNALNTTKIYALKTLNMSKKWREAAVNTKVYRKVQNITNTLINIVKNHPMTKKYLNSTIYFLNITRKYIHDLNISRYHPLAKKYINSTLHFLNVTRKVQNITNTLINIVKNHPMTKKYLNSTIYFLNITRKYIHDLIISRYHPLAKKYINSTLHFLNVTRKYIRALNFTKIANLAKSYAPIAFNMSKEMFKASFNATRIYTMKIKSYAPIAFNMTKEMFKASFNTTRTYAMKIKSYAPIAFNMTKEMFKASFNASRTYAMKVANVAWDVSADIYNSTCPRHALRKARNYTLKAFNETIKYYHMLVGKTKIKYSEVKQAVSVQKVVVLRKARSITMKLYNMTINNPITQQYLNSTIHFYNVTRNFIGKLNFTKIAKLAKIYVPKAFNVTKDLCKVGASAARNFTIKVSNHAWNISMDIYNSTTLKEALIKARNHSIKAYNETLKLYKILYKRTMIKYAEVKETLQTLYKNISEHNLTKEYMHHARKYYGHSMKILQTRARHFHHLKKYWHRRIAHKLNHMKNYLNPSYWIPPFNSTAMIFGKPHVYTFDSQYFRFPGYKNERCTYILARDVRDNKFTLMSQETALLLVTKDAIVKIHSDGRVETMTKINTEGEKINDRYDNELPVQSANMTVAREGPYVVLRHAVGLEILCDVEHNMCTFNIAKWYHGRLAGLLGTNNNEFHDEMMMPDNRIAKTLIEFVNSWEVSKDKECHIYKESKSKSKCSKTVYSSRCKELFKDKQSPLASFFKTVNPEPFMKACENDYADCDTRTPKDMKHCNTTASYIELLKMKGQWADYLPECGRCESHEMGTKWFQSSNKAVDIVLIVPETQGMRDFAKLIPNHITELNRALRSYSLKFGLVSFGGKGIHFHPHSVTINGKFLGNAEEVKSSIEHLKFSDTKDNETDGFEAIAKAAHYPFRAGSTKILVLLTTSERFANPSAPCIRRMTKKLQMRDITLNIIGKYQKYRGEVMGQDYLGRVFYRKHDRSSIRGVPLPEGDYVQLMANTKGSLFGMTFFASDETRKVSPFNHSYLNVLKEQIKRDQIMCKECFCARGRAGEGRTICKINKHHKC